MKKNLWILNHYASTMYINEGGRHHWFAKNLLSNDYETKIFCSNQVHNSDETISTDKRLFIEKISDNVSYVLVKSSKYQKNNFKRVLNILTFTINLIKTLKRYIRLNGKPDVMMASSVHPLTWFAGYQVSKKYKIPLIVEVRDLWPESLVAYGHIKQNSILAKILYKYEKWIYVKADAIIMSWEGGKRYIKDKKWEHLIDVDKIHYISNGYDESSFSKSLSNAYDDEDLKMAEQIKIVYTGSIREVNDLDMIVDTARLAKKANLKAKFLIFGEGDQRERLTQKCILENLDNIIFKGPVDKSYIPSILMQADIILIHNKSTLLDKYGQSQNKLFEAIASEKPIVQTYQPSYSPIDNYEIGFSVESQNPENILKLINEVITKTDLVMGHSFRQKYEFKHLTNKLIKVANQVNERKKRVR